MRPQILPPITLSVVVAAGGRTRRRTGVPGKPCPTAGKTSQQKLPILPPPVWRSRRLPGTGAGRPGRPQSWEQQRGWISHWLRLPGCTGCTATHLLQTGNQFRWWFFAQFFFNLHPIKTNLRMFDTPVVLRQLLSLSQAWLSDNSTWVHLVGFLKIGLRWNKFFKNPFLGFSHVQREAKLLFYIQKCKNIFLPACQFIHAASLLLSFTRI